jgi:hypothetical protein
MMQGDRETTGSAKLARTSVIYSKTGNDEFLLYQQFAVTTIQRYQQLLCDKVWWVEGTIAGVSLVGWYVFFQNKFIFFFQKVHKIIKFIKIS